MKERYKFFNSPIMSSSLSPCRRASRSENFYKERDYRDSASNVTNDAARFASHMCQGLCNPRRDKRRSISVLYALRGRRHQCRRKVFRSTTETSRETTRKTKNPRVHYFRAEDTEVLDISGLGKLMFFFNWIKLKLMALQN